MGLKANPSSPGVISPSWEGVVGRRGGLVPDLGAAVGHLTREGGDRAGTGLYRGVIIRVGEVGVSLVVDEEWFLGVAATQGVSHGVVVVLLSGL